MKLRTTKDIKRLKRKHITWRLKHPVVCGIDLLLGKCQVLGSFLADVYEKVTGQYYLDVLSNDPTAYINFEYEERRIEYHNAMIVSTHYIAKDIEDTEEKEEYLKWAFEIYYWNLYKNAENQETFKSFCKKVDNKITI